MSQRSDKLLREIAKTIIEPPVKAAGKYTISVPINVIHAIMTWERAKRDEDAQRKENQCLV